MIAVTRAISQALNLNFMNVNNMLQLSWADLITLIPCHVSKFTSLCSRIDGNWEEVTRNNHPKEKYFVLA